MIPQWNPQTTELLFLFAFLAALIFTLLHNYNIFLIFFCATAELARGFVGHLSVCSKELKIALPGKMAMS